MARMSPNIAVTSLSRRSLLAWLGSDRPEPAGDAVVYPTASYAGYAVVLPSAAGGQAEPMLDRVLVSSAVLEHGSVGANHHIDGRRAPLCLQPMM
jgi:hypothetical protein